MFPSLLTDTYEKYKRDTNDIATWFATTAKQLGCSAFLLSGEEKTLPIPLKSQRLKGKARTLAKEAAGKENTTSNPSKSRSKYTISVNKFVKLAEYIASRPGVHVPTKLWASIERAIRLRKQHADYHTLRKTKHDDGPNQESHFYFLGILEQVREVLKPRMQFEPVEPTKASPKPNLHAKDATPSAYLSNIFAVLTVEEPSEVAEDLATDTTPLPKSPTSSPARRYEVEPFEDPQELYLAIAALLKDLSNIRDTVKKIWLQ